MALLFNWLALTVYPQLKYVLDMVYMGFMAYPFQPFNNYRLLTAYLLLRVNFDKIMHWDFDASSAQIWRVSALGKHQIEAKVHYFVTILKHKVNTQLLI